MFSRQSQKVKWRPRAELCS